MTIIMSVGAYRVVTPSSLIFKSVHTGASFSLIVIFDFFYLTLVYRCVPIPRSSATARRQCMNWLRDARRASMHSGAPAAWCECERTHALGERFELASLHLCHVLHQVCE